MMPDPNLKNAQVSEYIFCFGDLEEFLLGYLRSIGEPTGQAGAGRLGPGGQAEVPRQEADIVLG